MLHFRATEKAHTYLDPAHGTQGTQGTRLPPCHGRTTAAKSKLDRRTATVPFPALYDLIFSFGSVWRREIYIRSAICVPAFA